MVVNYWILLTFYLVGHIFGLQSALNILKNDPTTRNNTVFYSVAW